jgi:hypothetical protein
MPGEALAGPMRHRSEPLFSQNPQIATLPPPRTSAGRERREAPPHAV